VCRVFESGDQDGSGVHSDGVHRVLREADLHPHQQHHRGHCVVTDTDGEGCEIGCFGGEGGGGCLVEL
jgi:hypothetical protein